MPLNGHSVVVVVIVVVAGPFVKLIGTYSSLL